jgi:hypothetical protein
MKLRLFPPSAIRVVATIFLGLMITAVQAAGAPVTRVVDDDGFASDTDCNALTPAFMMINAAIAAANPGDTIKVCPGIYNEMVSINVDNLTVLGAKAGIDARTRAFVAADESIIQHPCSPVQLAANSTVLDGFTIQGSTLSDPCLIAGIWSNPSALSKDGGYRILNDIVQNNISGIELDSNCVNPSFVQFNLIQNNNNPGPGSGNAIQTNFGLCNATIESNKFSGHTNASILVVAPSTTIAISSNELVGGASERIVLAVTTMSSITGNISIGSTSSGTVRLFGGNSNVAINGNTLFNGVRGVFVDDPFAIGANSGVTAHFNCIDGNTVAGMEVDSGGHSATLNAENNWWGSANGPTTPSNPGGTGDALIDPDGVVDFTPFLKSCPSGASAPSQATGGGQIAVTGGKGSFGFVAKQASQSGHLDYMNHVTGAHLNCTVDTVTFLSATAANFSGTCTANSASPTFSAHVEDNDKTTDQFIIMYGSTTEGGTIARGNINIK